MDLHPLLEPQTVDDLFLYRLTRLMAVAGAPVIRLCEGRYGVTRREWRLIAVLAAKGPCLSSELADLAHLDRGRTSKTVSLLDEKGLVVRRSRPHDRRLIEIHLTPAGQAVFDALFPEVARLNRDLLGFLAPEELGLIDALLARLQSRAEQWMAGADLPKADRRHRGRAPAKPPAPRENPGSG